MSLSETYGCECRGHLIWSLMCTLNGRTEYSEVKRAGVASEGLSPLVFFEHFFDFFDWLWAWLVGREIGNLADRISSSCVIDRFTSLERK